jgi:hypothetical protein
MQFLEGVNEIVNILNDRKFFTLMARILIKQYNIVPVTLVTLGDS